MLLLALAFKPVVEGDGVGYFSYLHSVAIDRDLDFTDEYAAAGQAHVNLFPSLLDARTAQGRLADFFPIGPALLSLPLYLPALVLAAGGPQYAPPLQAAFALASLLYGLLALLLAQRLARLVVGPRWAATAGAVAVLACTPLVYYLLYEPTYSHSFSAFAVTAFLLLWWSRRDARSGWGWVLLGLLGGFMALVRWADGPLIAIALLDLPRARWRLLLMAPGVLLAFSPQLVVDQSLFGTWLPVRPAGQDLDPLHGHYLEVLFSSHNGLLVWSPLVVAAAAGTLLVRHRAWRLAAAYALLVEVAVNGAAPDWWGGFAFGPRRFLDLTPFVAVGVAAVAARIGPRVAVTGVAVLAAWNLLEIANLTYVIRTDHDPGYLGLLRGQAAALPHLPQLFAQGAVARNLVLEPLLGRAYDVQLGLGLLAAEVAAVAGAYAVLRPRLPRPPAVLRQRSPRRLAGPGT